MAQTKIISGGITDSSVTNIKIDDVAASKLTGALPAISGANLTNLPTETKPTITSCVGGRRNVKNGIFSHNFFFIVQMNLVIQDFMK